MTERHRSLAVSRLAELRAEDRELTRYAAAFASGVRPRTLAAVRGLPQDVAEGGEPRLHVHFHDSVFRRFMKLHGADVRVVEAPTRDAENDGTRRDP